MEYYSKFKNAVVYVSDFQRYQIPGRGGDIWAAQPPLKLQKHSLFPGKSFSPLLYNMLWNLSEVVIKKI